MVKCNLYSLLQYCKSGGGRTALRACGLKKDDCVLIKNLGARKDKEDSLVQNVLENMLDRNSNVQTTTYDGFLEFSVMGIIYLVEENPKVCAIFAPIVYSLRTYNALQWEDIGLTWLCSEELPGRPHFLQYPGPHNCNALNRKQFVGLLGRCNKRVLVCTLT